jgi:hypothetical protein
MSKFDYEGWRKFAKHPIGGWEERIWLAVLDKLEEQDKRIKQLEDELESL